MDRVLTQEEIDSVFRNLRDQSADEDPAKKATPYDFRRPDRIAKDQLRAIHLLHEAFARSLSSSLSAYLPVLYCPGIIRTSVLRSRTNEGPSLRLCRLISAIL